MARFVIEGGHPLKGEINISGSKNAALPIMAAALLANGESIIENVPNLWDVRSMAFVLRALGAQVEDKDGAMRIKVPSRLYYEAPYELVKTMRASVLVLGPLLAKLKRARVSLPGGCSIGVRPVDLHLKGLAKMGVDIKINQGYIEAKAPRLKGARIRLDFASVGATEDLMIAAVLAKGRTIIENAAREPEITDLQEFLIKMGARIRGAGSPVITINGVDRVKGVHHKVIPDRIETGTFLLAGAATKGRILLKGANATHLKALINKLKETGVGIYTGKDFILVEGKANTVSADIITRPYPGFPTDLQPQMTSFLSICRGSSRITETIFENRFTHAAELQRMGADIEIDGKSIIVSGVKKLTGTSVMASDIRCGAALVVAGLAAHKQTKVLRIYHIDRGYENLEGKLTQLGAKIKRIK